MFALSTVRTLVAALAVAGAPAMHHAAAKPAAALAPSPIHQEVVLDASPEKVYAALLDSAQFAAITHMPAAIDNAPGGAFHTFGGMIEGRNVELLPGRRIVQAWRPHDWPAGVFSVVRFVLLPEGDGTRLVLTHSNYEEGEPKADLERGWREHYFEPMKAYFAAAAK